MNIGDERYLRRTFTPYAGQVIILALVTFGSLIVSWERDVWGLFFSMPVGWFLYSIFVFIALKYRISYSSEVIRRRASGGPDALIKIDDITNIELERASINEMVAQSAPYRRIKISDGKGVPINVSLRHFRDEDIRQLIAVIHSKRPDLSLPKGFETVTR